MADPPIASDAPGIDTDILCVHCGYNLRGMPQDSRCPECGTAVADSLRGNLLRFADPAWVGTLWRGTSLKLWNVGFGIIGGAAGGILLQAGFAAGGHLIVALIGGLLGVIASFQLTAQEPRVALSEDPITLRKFIRVCMVVALAGSVMAFIEPVAGAAGWVLAVGGSLLSMAGYVGYFAELVYYKRLALRIPDEALAKSTGQLTWMLGISGSLMIAGGVTMFILAARAGAAGPPGAVPGMVGGMACLGFVMLFCLLWYVRLLTRYRKAFRQAVLEAHGQQERPPVIPGG